MIFDSPEIQALCRQYAQRPKAQHPLAVHLAQSPEMVGERVYIENLVASAPAKTQARWIAALTDPHDEHHIPIWFEVMLFGWLSEIGRVTVEPSVEGNEPDFGLLVEEQELFVEAKAVLRERSERDSDRQLAELMEVLKGIQRPYAVSIEKIQFGTPLETEELIAQVDAWLRTAPEEAYTYRDKRGNTVLLRAQPIDGLRSVGVVGLGQSLWVNADILKPALRKKASQHSALREARFPYVLAFFLEHWAMSAEEIAEAWIGQTEYIIDVEAGKVVDQRLKPSGLHFHRNQILHTSVSGTLVFKAEWNKSLERQELKAWYVENPFARVPVDPAIFPVRSRFVVVSRDAQGVRMDWRHPVSD